MLETLDDFVDACFPRIDAVRCGRAEGHRARPPSIRRRQMFLNSDAPANTSKLREPMFCGNVVKHSVRVPPMAQACPAQTSDSWGILAGPRCRGPYSVFCMRVFSGNASNLLRLLADNAGREGNQSGCPDGSGVALRCPGKVASTMEVKGG